MPKLNQRKNMDMQMIFCVRNDLKMGKGKIAAQVGHAVLGLYKQNLNDKNSTMLEKWEATGQAKIVVKINSEKEMYNIFVKAQQMGISTHIVQDAGKTQIESGSNTVIAIGPDFKNRLNQVTGHLKLM